MQWSFSFSIWVVAGLYDSTWNGTNHTAAPVIEVDDCGPANLISPGYALWLVLVPAVACVVQLPGSTFLFQRSNFYRFSPELGIIDTVNVLILILKGMFRGYRWYECIAAVVTVRHGIGNGMLWWREDLSQQHSSTNLETTTELHADTLEDILTSKLAPTLEPLSSERVLGAGLAAAAFLKVIALLATTSNSEVRLACFLALAYMSSYLILETMTWVILIPQIRSALSSVPPENFLELTRLIDPGDNPFTFPRHEQQRQEANVFNMATLNIVHAVSSLTPMTAISMTNPVNQMYPWFRPVAFTVFSLGLLGPLVWILMLSHIWSVRSGPWILAAGAVAFLLCRALGKLALPKLSQFTTTTPASTSPSRRHRTLAVWFLLWLWHRCTTVNLYSAIWLGVIVFYFVSIFPTEITQAGNTVRKPVWLDWLG